MLIFSKRIERLDSKLVICSSLRINESRCFGAEGGATRNQGLENEGTREKEVWWLEEEHIGDQGLEERNQWLEGQKGELATVIVRTTTMIIAA